MSKLFSPKLPKTEKEPVAPVPDDLLERINQQRAYQRRRQSGRASTVLSNTAGNNLG